MDSIAEITTIQWNVQKIEKSSHPTLLVDWEIRSSPSFIYHPITAKELVNCPINSFIMSKRQGFGFQIYR